MASRGFTGHVGGKKEGGTLRGPRGSGLDGGGTPCVKVCTRGELSSLSSCLIIKSKGKKKARSPNSNHGPR